MSDKVDQPCYSKFAALLRELVGLVERMPNATSILQAPAGQVVASAKAALRELDDKGILDIEAPKTDEEWRIGWITRECAVAFWKGKAQELERLLKKR